MPLGYNFDKLKFASGSPMWERAVDLYTNGKVTKFTKDIFIVSAIVNGTHSYRVVVDKRHFDRGNCECYLGQKGELCKHMIAIAIYAVQNGKPIAEDEKKFVSTPTSSGRLAILSAEEKISATSAISDAMKCIKSYGGSSKKWFAYQAALIEGCNRLSSTFSKLPVGQASAELVIRTLIRLDKKLCQGGVDDSDGTVSECMDETVQMLLEYTYLDPLCIHAFKLLSKHKMCFDWRDPLLELSLQSKHPLVR